MFKKIQFIRVLLSPFLVMFVLCNTMSCQSNNDETPVVVDVVVDDEPDEITYKLPNIDLNKPFVKAIKNP